MASIIDALRSDHSRLTKLLDALERQVDAFGEGGTLDFQIADGVLHYCRTYPDLHHHPREDLVFERLKARDPATAEALGDLRGEHRKLAQATERFAAALEAVEQDVPMERDELTGAAGDFLKAYRHHIMMEEKHFFPAAQRALTPEDWRQLAAQSAPVADPLFDIREDERFDALFEDIVAWDSNLPSGA
ncbi:hemerythrin domain-containing protein [Pelagibius sp. CAU 1746]|uniref:hemerythrin domain-containing protein n=1 Tax=Pelagibius sp. CAU 1746 TaxID=3140370 RepID=UPI00325C2B02